MLPCTHCTVKLDYKAATPQRPVLSGTRVLILGKEPYVSSELEHAECASGLRPWCKLLLPAVHTRKPFSLLHHLFVNLYLALTLQFEMKHSFTSSSNSPIRIQQKYPMGKSLNTN